MLHHTDSVSAQIAADRHRALRRAAEERRRVRQGRRARSRPPAWHMLLAVLHR